MKRYEVVIDVYSPVTHQHREVVDRFRWLWLAKLLCFLHLVCPPPPGGDWLVIDAFVREVCW